MSGTHGVDDVLVSLGVDYVTATALETSDYQPLHSRASSMFHHQAQIGNQPKPWGMSGFKGWSCGSVAIGRRQDETIVRLSSDAAALGWRGVVQLASNVSRLDLQATVRGLRGPTATIDKHRREARRNALKHNQKRVVRWVQDNRDGYTLYLGQRSSICFGRIYDKFAQSKLEHYEGCVRYEVQYHNKLALNIACALQRLDSPLPTIASYCSEFFEGRGILLDLPYRNGATYCCSRTRSDVDKNLSWLRTAVRPTVLRLIALDRGEDLMRALGLIDDVGPT